MGAAHAKIDQQFAGCSQYAARRLGGDQGLQVQDVDQTAFHQLRLGQWRDDAQNGLVGEKYCPFRQSLDGAGKAEIGQRGDEIGAESPGAGQPVQFRRLKAQVLQIIQRLFQTGGEQKATLLRQAAHEQLEHSRFMHALGVVSLEHGELIQVGQQHAVSRVHGGWLLVGLADKRCEPHLL